MIIAQALLFKNRFRIVEVADEQIECDKFSFHKTILSTHCSSAFSTPDSHYLESDDIATLCSDFLQVGPYSSLLEARITMQEWLKWLDKGLRAARYISDKKSESAYLINLGNALVNSGKSLEGLVYFIEARELSLEIDARQLLGRALGSIGNAYAEAGQEEQAVNYYNQALEVFREIGDQRSEGAVLTNLGLEYRKSGDTLRAIQNHSEALAIARKVGDWRGEGIRIGDLGNAYAQAGELSKAARNHKDALKTLKKLGDRLEISRARWNLSRVLAMQGNFTTAIREAETAVEYFHLINHPVEDEILLSLVEWTNAQGDE